MPAHGILPRDLTALQDARSSSLDLVNVGRSTNAFKVDLVVLPSQRLFCNKLRHTGKVIPSLAAEAVTLAHQVDYL